MRRENQIEKREYYGESEEEDELERELVELLEEEIADHDEGGAAEGERRRARADGVEGAAVGRREAGERVHPQRHLE